MRIDQDNANIKIVVPDPSKIEGCQLSAITHFLQKCLDWEKPVFISANQESREIVFEVKE